jgi:hypothetical protein
MNKPQTQRPTTLAEVIEFPHIEEMTESEINIEARLRELTDFVEKLGDAAFNFFLTERVSVREAIEELIVKKTALRWIVRVAKRSTGRVRENLWEDIDRILTDLEVTAKAVMLASEKWAHIEFGGRCEPMVCLHRF